MKILSVILVTCLLCSIRAMTRPQLKKSLQLMKNNCMGKNKVTEAEIGDIESGKFIEQHEVMCYIACVYQMLQIIKNGKLDKAKALKQVDFMFPEDMKDPVKITIEKCSGVPSQYKDLCEGSFYAAKCLYENDPKNFVFP